MSQGNERNNKGRKQYKKITYYIDSNALYSLLA